MTAAKKKHRAWHRALVMKDGQVVELGRVDEAAWQPNGHVTCVTA